MRGTLGRWNSGKDFLKCTLRVGDVANVLLCKGFLNSLANDTCCLLKNVY